MVSGVILSAVQQSDNSNKNIHTRLTIKGKRMTDVNIFYPWQSDLPSGITRNFIRNAANKAINNIQRDIEIEESPRLDSDTQGNSGMPDIPATIFNKISKCGIFLADLSFVGHTYEDNGKDQKKLPNANVLLELGYAASKAGWDRIICVMNTFYGAPEEIIFDIKHRRYPITFCLKDNKEDDFKNIKNDLEKELETAIKASLQSSHQFVEDSLKRLDVDCLTIISEHGSKELFNLKPPVNVAASVSTQKYVHAAFHMLGHGLIETQYDPENMSSSYKWTYLGKQVLKRLGIRPSSMNKDN